MEITPGRPVSKSAVSLFEKCAFYYYCLYVLGHRDEPGQAAINGIMTHAWRAKVFGKEITADEALNQAENEDVRRLTELTLAVDPHAYALRRELEQETRINENGELVDDIMIALARGFLDDLALYPSFLVVEDLKTGKWEKDDPFERHLYAGLLAKAKYPDCDEIHFVRHYCRSGNRPEWIYRWSKRVGVNKLQIIGPNNKKEEYFSGQDNPLVPMLVQTIDKIKEAEPKPNPGKQCQSWFGKPCQFRDTICPHFHPDTGLIIMTSGQLEPQDDDRYRRSIEAVRSAEGDALLQLDNDTISRAYEACLTVSSGVRQLEKKIKSWATANGSFVVGDANYGWHSEKAKILNEPLALQMILESNMEIPDILKCINISISSVGKIPKRKWGELKQSLTSAAITDGETKPQFGVIKDKED